MARMALVRPRIVAFNGKRAAQAVLGPLRSYGLQPVQLVGAEIFVLPSTSGAASGFWSIEPWKELAAHLAGTGTR
jgi:TDG/mug DNA glycosylase family protein